MRIGVDFGLTQLRAAYVEDGKPVLLESLTGRRSLPAVVGIDKSGRLHVGDSAKNQLLLEPDRAIARLRRLLGTSQRVLLGGQSFAPQELCAVLLAQLRDIAETRCGQPTTAVHLAVPCEFTPEQRAAARDAALLAGFRQVTLVREPEAVVAAYGIRPADVELGQQILVCDLGARACEAAVIERSGERPAPLDIDRVDLIDYTLAAESPLAVPPPPPPPPSLVIRKSSTVAVGSDVCDARIIAHLCHLYEREFGVSPQGSRKVMARLRLAAEWVKHALSERDTAHLRLPELLYIGDASLDLEADMSREQLELLVEDELRRSLECIEIVRRQTAHADRTLTTVLLSGGGAEMPLVRRLVSSLLPVAPLDLPAAPAGSPAALSPQTAIACGAALLGARA
ncbi:MAG TPA: Hsp70 family protein [Pseudomonadota bacterium]|nr:Hsp70 family protein [Pseudomonadota bacterium]